MIGSILYQIGRQLPVKLYTILDKYLNSFLTNISQELFFVDA